jgi:site-specific recombinase XerD
VGAQLFWSFGRWLRRSLSFRLPAMSPTVTDMVTRLPLPDAGSFRPFIDSFDIYLRSERKAASTVRGYREAAIRLAGWLLANTDAEDWCDVTTDHLRAYVLWMAEDESGPHYSVGHLGNQHRNLRQFWRWWSDEEQLPNPHAAMREPRGDVKVIPVISQQDLAALIKDAESRDDFAHRRDLAILRLFASSGARLSEISNLQLSDIDKIDKTAFVHGKGRKDRHVRFDNKANRAIDRYVRIRAKHKAAALPALWLGVGRSGGMTPSGVYQVIARRGERLGIALHPHMFRHTFSHNWLDKGGAEGDLMQLNGWTSPQMLRRYGASAAAARAQRAYDRIDVMDGL